MTLELPQEVTPVTPKRETPGERAQRVQTSLVEVFPPPYGWREDALDLARDVLALEAVARRLHAALDSICRETDQFGSHMDGTLHAIARTAIDPPPSTSLPPEEQRVLDLLREAQ